MLIAIADQTNAYEIAEEMTQVRRCFLVCQCTAEPGPVAVHRFAIYLAVPSPLPAARRLQYVKDSDEDLARAAIRSVGQIALKVRPAPLHPSPRRQLLVEALLSPDLHALNMAMCASWR